MKNVSRNEFITCRETLDPSTLDLTLIWVGRREGLLVAGARFVYNLCGGSGDMSP